MQGSPAITSAAKRRWIPVLDGAVIFLLSALLIGPLFRAKYLDRWSSIESTFIADGRFLAAHWPHPQWQPLWYGGTRFDYIYPPVLRYGTALLSRSFIPVKAYHVFTAVLFCVGIAGVYFLVRALSGSRGSAWLAAAACALVSPSFLFIQPVRDDAPYLTPQRLGVLLRYGEGPHISAVSLLPFALMFTFFAIQRRSSVSLALAAIFSALVALTNFYGATSLAILYSILIWALWITHRGTRPLRWGAAIPVLAYGLAAFWLTPSYLKTTVDNLKYVAESGNPHSLIITIAVAAAFAAASYWWAAGRKDRIYPVFAGGGMLFLGLAILGYYRFHLLVVGNPVRLIPELDMLTAMAVIEALRRLCSVSRLWRTPAILLVVAGCWSAKEFVRHAWSLYPREPDYRQRVEYRSSEWMAEHLPQARTMSAGSIRLWWDTWHDLAQVDGGSDQGLINPNPPAAMWIVTRNESAQTPVLWLKAFGADAVIVSAEPSREAYHEYVAPRKFDGVLPVLYDDHEGTVIYGVSRRFPSLARVVRSADLQGVGPAIPPADIALLKKYTDIVEDGPDSRAEVAWDGTDALRVRARVAQGEAILVQETYDPAWRAYSSGSPLRIWRDAMGFMAIDAPPGDVEVSMQFHAPLENRVGQGITLLAVALCLFLLIRRETLGNG